MMGRDSRCVPKHSSFPALDASLYQLQPPCLTAPWLPAALHISDRYPKCKNTNYSIILSYSYHVQPLPVFIPACDTPHPPSCVTPREALLQRAQDVADAGVVLDFFPLAAAQGEPFDLGPFWDGLLAAASTGEEGSDDDLDDAQSSVEDLHAMKLQVRPAAWIMLPVAQCLLHLHPACSTTCCRQATCCHASMICVWQVRLHQQL